MKKIFYWFTASSADPAKFSLTLKAAVPFVLAIVVFFKLDIAQGDLDQFVEAVMMIITGGAVALGLLRKIVLTLQGRNHETK